MNVKNIIFVSCVVLMITGCTNDPKSMWNSRYAFKSLGSVQAMCDDGDRDACYAAMDMQGLTNGLNSANASMQQQQALQAQQDGAQPRMTTTTCNPLGNTITCQTY